MKVQDLDFSYPEELVATEPQRPPRVMWIEKGEPREIAFAEVLENIPAGDLLVVNETRVLRRRVFAGDLEILFLDRAPENPREWKVLFPSRKFKVGDRIELPDGHVMTLKGKGRPQVVETEKALTEEDFEKFGELPLPPYIQKARNERHNRGQDDSWYQTAWAEKPGSMAAPTASLHFSDKDIAALEARGVRVLRVTLHVGLGTFLPVTAEDLNDHVMHSEWAEIPASVWEALTEARSRDVGIWALGTTVARTLESAAHGKLERGSEGSLQGWTDLLIQPGFHWKMVNRLLTNFHQPQSTLLALVAGFSSLETVKSAYSWAIEKKFRLFSYGDLSVWIK